LAVALLAARLRAHPERALAGLARRLETGETGGLDAVGGGGRALRAVFDLSFQALPDGAKAVFGAIGVHPGRDYTADAIAAVTGTTGEEADRELDRLLDEYLVRETTRGRYEVHDLVHDYAVEIAADVFPDRSAAFDRLARWYLHSAHAAALAIEAFNLPEMKPDPEVRPAVFESYDAAMAWYDAETENLRAVHQVAAASGLVDVCWRLAVCLRTFMNLRVRIEDNYGFHQRAAEVARAHGEPKTLAFMLIGMSTPAQQLDRPEEAEAVLTEALRLAEATGDLVNQGRAMMERGTMLNRLGRPAEAVPLWQDVIAIYESLGDRRSVMLSHLNLGVMQFGLGHPDLSWDEFQHALREAQAVGEPRAECIIRGNIGELLVHRGDYAQAHAHFLEHHAFAEAIGDRQQCAESLAGQGNALHGLGRVAEAEQLWTAALAMFEELNGSAQTAREVRERLERLKRSREDPAAAGATARPESG
ncbi:MAG: tetratricopeptide repeat protein, partial [Catenulispora sp.]|nr:tetratricopeptide repeat protein [Catenulispora sp.]